MWFSAKLLFETVNKSDNQVLQEESIRILQAIDVTEATEKACKLGIESEHDYVNSANEQVKWIFVEVIEIQDLCESSVFDGMEVFSFLKWKNR